MSYVTEFPAAEPQEAVTHFLRLLSVETDCADVHHAIANNEQDFVLLHVVGSPEQFARRHVPGALHLPRSQMTADAWPNGLKARCSSFTAQGRTVTARTEPR